MTKIPILSAIRTAFKGSRPYVEAAFVALGIFALFVLVPVWTTPGNDVLFQLRLMKPSAYVLMTILALLNGLLIEMQLYLRRNRRAHRAGKQATTAFGIAVSSLLATVSCASCYSSLLALFGLGGSVFIVTNRWWFAAAAIGLTLFALAFTSRRVMGQCEACEIAPKAPKFRLW